MTSEYIEVCMCKLRIDIVVIEIIIYLKELKQSIISLHVHRYFLFITTPNCDYPKISICIDYGSKLYLK